MAKQVTIIDDARNNSASTEAVKQVTIQQDTLYSGGGSSAATVQTPSTPTVSKDTDAVAVVATSTPNKKGADSTKAYLDLVTAKQNVGVVKDAVPMLREEVKSSEELQRVIDTGIVESVSTPDETTPVKTLLNKKNITKAAMIILAVSALVYVVFKK